MPSLRMEIPSFVVKGGCFKVSCSKACKKKNVFIVLTYSHTWVACHFYYRWIGAVGLTHDEESDVNDDA